MQRAANDNIGKLDKDGLATTPKACPICNKPARWDMRPFCSKRCADVDLHRWLGGSYSVPEAESDEVRSGTDSSDQ